MTKVTNVVSVKEVPIPGGATVVAGMMVVNADTNGVVVVPSNQTAAALATLLGCSAIKTVDYPARVGAFPDTGKPIFEV
jgi:regulator of RNase E activity RraA